MKNIAILGSTGSIGTQALEIIELQKDDLQVSLLTANTNVSLLIEQSKKFLPNAVVIADETKYSELKQALGNLPIKVFAGKDSIDSLVTMDEVDIVLTAMVGFSGLSPTISAINAGKAIALANKETLVVAGEIISELAIEKRVTILPVDSEHSAIFQCLVGEGNNKIEKIILTASGGPFRGKTRKELELITKEQALKHPNWDMGAKITIDSATLMNKGLEVIEAKWLFGLELNQIEVIVHPQSIIHSMVQFEDGSIKAQLGLPDMRLPIQYAMNYPNRGKNVYNRLGFTNYAQFTFEKPDLDTFPNLGIAFEVLRQGGNAPCIMNAANEIAVGCFLKEEVSFLGITTVIEDALSHFTFLKKPTLEDLFETDKEVRSYLSSKYKKTTKQ